MRFRVLIRKIIAILRRTPSWERAYSSCWEYASPAAYLSYCTNYRNYGSAYKALKLISESANTETLIQSIFYAENELISSIQQILTPVRNAVNGNQLYHTLRRSRRIRMRIKPYLSVIYQLNLLLLEYCRTLEININNAKARHQLILLRRQLNNIATPHFPLEDFICLAFIKLLFLKVSYTHCGLNIVKGMLSPCHKIPMMKNPTHQLLHQFIGLCQTVGKADLNIKIVHPDLRNLCVIAPGRKAKTIKQIPALTRRSAKQFLQHVDGEKPLKTEITFFVDEAPEKILAGMIAPANYSPTCSAKAHDCRRRRRPPYRYMFLPWETCLMHELIHGIHDMKGENRLDFHSKGCIHEQGIEVDGRRWPDAEEYWTIEGGSLTENLFHRFLHRPSRSTHDGGVWLVDFI